MGRAHSLNGENAGTGGRQPHRLSMRARLSVLRSMIAPRSPAMRRCAVQFSLTVERRPFAFVRRSPIWTVQ